MAYYRVSRNELKTGDVIWEAGLSVNAAANLQQTRAIVRIGHAHLIPFMVANQGERALGEAATAYKEVVLENVRTEEFPELPVRYDNMMAFTNIDDARAFNRDFRNGVAKIYEVEVGDSKPFLGDINVLSDIKSWDLTEVQKMSRRYWSGGTTSTPTMEAIFYPGSVITVVREVL